MNWTGKLGLSAGDGLGESSALLSELLAPILSLPAKLEDGHRVQTPSDEITVTTDVYSVNPILFPGGDIGSLAACGAINDLAASGARMDYCTLGIYASADLDGAVFERCLRSFAEHIGREGANIVAGDTKVHPDPWPELLLVTTAIGTVVGSSSFDLDRTVIGDDIFVTGPLGDHSVAVLSAREGLGFDSVVSSDAHSLSEPILDLARRGLVHSLRDLTRGGLVAALWDVHKATGFAVEITDAQVPVNERTRAAAEMLGLDLLALTNEGCMLVTAPTEFRMQILEVLRGYQATKRVAVIGSIGAGPSSGPTCRTGDGSRRLIELPGGLGVPRLC
jgi:hydrogenase expression/formation protein HypE